MAHVNKGPLLNLHKDNNIDKIENSDNFDNNNNNNISSNPAPFHNMT